jgi:NADPH-dependent 2,4-dienoyl-CoA reductase/sulfur reductase-like enzyme
MTRYVIVGAGVAGISAAGALRSLDRTAEITVVSEDAYGFYSRPGLAYYLTRELPENQLAIYTKKDWQSLNLHHVHARVMRIIPGEHRLYLDPAGALTYDRLLLAAGSTAVRSNIPGADLNGVVKLDDLEDTRRIITAEDHTVIGGLGSAVADVIAKSGKGCVFRKLGYQDEFSIVGYPEDLLHHYKIDADGILEAIGEVVRAEFEQDENWEDED